MLQYWTSRGPCSRDSVWRYLGTGYSALVQIHVTFPVTFRFLTVSLLSIPTTLFFLAFFPFPLPRSFAALVVPPLHFPSPSYACGGPPRFQRDGEAQAPHFLPSSGFIPSATLTSPSLQLINPPPHPPSPPLFLNISTSTSN